MRPSPRSPFTATASCAVFLPAPMHGSAARNCCSAAPLARGPLPRLSTGCRCLLQHPQPVLKAGPLRAPVPVLPQAAAPRRRLLLLQRAGTRQHVFPPRVRRDCAARVGKVTRNARCPLGCWKRRAAELPAHQGSLAQRAPSRSHMRAGWDWRRPTSLCRWTPRVSLFAVPASTVPAVATAARC